MTVSSTRNETGADRAHHLSKVEQTIVLREQKEAQKELPKLTKKEQRRDRSQRKDQKEDSDQKDHLKKEEEADPDRESMSGTGQAHEEGQVHHVHGHKAKDPKAKEKGKMLSPKAKTKIRRVKVKRKDRRTSITFQTKLMNGIIHFANIARAMTWQIVVGNMKSSNAFH